MHAEPEQHLVLLAGRPGCEVGTRRECDVVIRYHPAWRTHAADLGVSDIEAHVEVLGDVPLGSRADPPPVPVVVATGLGQRSRASTNSTSTEALRSAKNGIGLTVILHFRIAAVDRRPPPRAPEVLIRRVDVPGRGQVHIGCIPSTQCAAKDPIRHDVHGNATLIVLVVRVAVRVLEDVLQCTLGIVDLGLEVVARADHRRIQLEAAADRKAPLFVGVTTAFWGRRNGGGGVEVIRRVDLVPGSGDLSRTPSLVDAQIGDDVRSLEAAVTSTCRAAATSEGTEPPGEAADAVGSAPATGAPMSCVRRGSSAAIEAEKPLPNCAV